MNFKKPLVSILIPNYNYSKYLDNCLESVLNQTYSNIEVIFRDNASTDDSYEKALKYQKMAKGHFFVGKNRRNIGSFGNTARCFEEAEGNYILYLSSDDAIKPTFVEKCMEIMTEYKNIGFVMTHREEMDEEGNITEVPPFYNQSCVIPGEAQAAVFMMEGIAVPSQILRRREAIYSVAKERMAFQIAADWYDNFVMSCTYDVGYIKDALCQYRIHNSNETNSSERDLMGVFEHYMLINAFKRIASSHGLQKPVDRYEAAVEKLGDMCLRYCLKMLKINNKEIAHKYLYLAPVFKPNIINEENYKALMSYANQAAPIGSDIISEFEKQGVFKRTISYDPPDGFIPIK